MRKLLLMLLLLFPVHDAWAELNYMNCYPNKTIEDVLGKVSEIDETSMPPMKYALDHEKKTITNITPSLKAIPSPYKRKKGKYVFSDKSMLDVWKNEPDAKYLTSTVEISINSGEFYMLGKKNKIGDKRKTETFGYCYPFNRITSLFGFVFGTKLEDIPKENILEKIGNDHVIVEPLIKNKEFTKYMVWYTPKSKIIESVAALVYKKKSDLSINQCIEKLESVKKTYLNKYPFLKETKKDFSDDSEKKIDLGNKNSSVHINCSKSKDKEGTFFDIRVTDTDLIFITIREKKELVKENTDTSGY